MSFFNGFPIDPATHLNVQLKPEDSNKEGNLVLDGRSYSVTLEGGTPESIAKTKALLENLPEDRHHTFKEFYATLTEKREDELDQDIVFKQLELDQSREENIPDEKTPEEPAPNKENKSDHDAALKQQGELEQSLKEEPYEFFSNIELKKAFFEKIDQDLKEIKRLQDEVRTIESSGYYADKDSPIVHKAIVAVQDIFKTKKTQKRIEKIKETRVQLLETCYKYYQVNGASSQKPLQNMLELALFTERVAYVNLLIDAGATIGPYEFFLAIGLNSPHLVERFLKLSPVDINAPNHNGHSLFEISCLRGKKSFEAMKVLLKAGGNLTKVDRDHSFISGDNPLHLLIDSDLPSKDVIAILKQVKNLDIPDSNMSLFNTALYRLYFQKDDAIFRYLIKRGCNPNKAYNNIYTRGGFFPMHQAIDLLKEDQLKDVVKGLLEAGHKPNQRNARQSTPLHIAASKAYRLKGKEIIHMLKRAGEETNARDKEGQTPLHYAVQAGSQNTNKNFVTHLLNLKDIDVNAQDNEGNTPLHLAVQSNQPGIVKLLLQKGANRNLRNLEGKFPAAMNMFSFTDDGKEILNLLGKP